MPWFSERCLFNCTYVQHATHFMAKCVHSNTAAKIWNTSFSVLACHGLLYWYEVSGLQYARFPQCSIEHVWNTFFCPNFKQVTDSKLSQTKSQSHYKHCIYLLSFLWPTNLYLYIQYQESIISWVFDQFWGFVNFWQTKASGSGIALPAPQLLYHWAWAKGVVFRLQLWNIFDIRNIWLLKFRKLAVRHLKEMQSLK